MTVRLINFSNEWSGGDQVIVRSIEFLEWGWGGGGGVGEMTSTCIEGACISCFLVWDEPGV